MMSNSGSEAMRPLEEESEGRLDEFQAIADKAMAASNTLAELPAHDFLTLLAQGEVTASDYAQSFVDRIERFDPALQAFKSFDRDRFLARAALLDRRIAENAMRGEFTGVPVAVKDIFNTYDHPTSMGSEILEGYQPGNDARVVSDLRLEGAIVSGKTVTAEFAVHHPGPTRNPHDVRRTPGTSSSGSAVAVAARLSPVALCSQTAGSTIRPASYNGVMGFKPSFGLVPRTAVLKTTDTLDTIGFMGRDLRDLRSMFEICRVHGHNYPTSERHLLDPARRKPADRAWRVGVLEGPRTAFEAAEPQRRLQEVCRALEAAGCQVERFALPTSFQHAHDVHQRIYHKALQYYFKLEWEAKKELFSPRLRAVMDDGAQVSPERYLKDCAEQTRLAAEMDRLFLDADVDVVVGLSTSDSAPRSLYDNGPEDHCLIWTLCGCPALSLPLLAGEGGLPVGLQVASRKYNDYKLLDFAGYLWNRIAS